MEESLLFSTSPLCPLAAEVVESDTCIYFYLYDMNFEEERLITRSACWVKNRIPAPEQFDFDVMEDGKAPVVPAQYCKDPDDIAPLHAQDLSIVWSKEGHICALYDKEDILAIIPSWAVPGEMSGYSRNAKAEHMSGWGLEESNALIPRMEEGRRFWDQDFHELWMGYSTKWLSELEQRYGAPVQCLRLSEEEAFPTIFLMIYEQDGIQYAFTAGLGQFAMPNADQYFESYEEKARSEYAFAWKSGVLSETQQHEVFSQLSAIAHLPWQAIDYIGHGHTLDFHVMSYEYAICVRNAWTPYQIETEGVNITWLIPITQDEFATMQEKKSNQTLIQTLKSHHRNILDVRSLDQEA